MHVPGPTPIRTPQLPTTARRSADRRRVLVVDDDLPHRILTATLLHAAGYAPSAVGSVPRALERIRSDGPELVLTDLVMPELDGLDLLRALRLMPNGPLAIAMTASDDHELAGEAIELGALAVLHKPFSEVGLAAAIRAGFDAFDDGRRRKIA